MLKFSKKENQPNVIELQHEESRDEIKRKPADVNVIHSICVPLGKVVRVVIFRKNGVQAMVEFENVDTARLVLSELDNKEIYRGCCRLKVEFAKPTKLNVTRNNSETWDFSNKTNVVTAESSESAVTEETANGLLPYPNDLNDELNMRNDVKLTKTDLKSWCIAGFSRIGDTLEAELAQMSEDYFESGSVIMVYNLDRNRINPDGVFNLFCMYGNVWKVKFLKSIKGCAMVQMGDREAVNRCMRYLQGLPLFGSIIQLGSSKQAFLGEMGRGFELPDGSLSWRDFSNSKNNRFLTPEMAKKNRLNAPSRVLHFFNMPPSLTEERLEGFILTTGQVRLVDLTVFSSKGDKPSSGLMEFESIEDAATCIVNCNNVPMLGNDSGPPFFIKLCYSSVSSIIAAEHEFEKRGFK